MAAYLIALRSFSSEAIRDSVEAVLTGAANINPRFAPTPPELASLCRTREERVRRELERAKADATSIPEPITITPEEAGRRAEKAARASALIDSALGHMDVTPEPANGP